MLEKILTIDPSGTGTTGLCWIIDGIVSFEQKQFKNKEWREHLKYLIDLVKEQKPNIIVFEDTTYMYGRQHQGTVGLYKLIGGIVSMEYLFNFVVQIKSMTVNQVKAFKKKLFEDKEQIEGLTCEVGRGKGWKYKGKKISLHQLDALVIYHLWSGKSLESVKNIEEKIVEFKRKKRLGPKQKEQLEKLEKLINYE